MLKLTLKPKPAKFISLPCHGKKLNKIYIIRTFNSNRFCKPNRNLATILGLANRIDDCNDFKRPDNDQTDGEGMDCPILYHLSENKKANRTQMFDQEDLIVRRAGTFKITIKFDREVNEVGDVVRLDLSVGKKPSGKVFD